jgi:ATP-dependent RNA helicase SUPV3L1/SUV3
MTISWKVLIALALSLESPDSEGDMGSYDQQDHVWAVLGPTNTGKTYLAIDRMLGHATGMIGFPLRLLARENYDRIVALKGKGAVALITGEEKIIPACPRWFVCTVESMPLDREVDFLAIDEIQLCADGERGHVFTDRVLHARGREETLFLGSDTISVVLKKLAPNVRIETRPRFSVLTHTGTKKLSRLPRRSAIVAFSVSEVYALAELIRRHRGGTAVVLGALSPRTRNAQVAMYQAGEVDYMVATDAVGMGLNMDVDHVAFAGMRKFDGRAPRLLNAAETGQIAGRAGRYLSDGTFGVTNSVTPFDDELVDAVESHRYAPLEHVYWRNRTFDFRSTGELLRGLSVRPPSTVLKAARRADDHVALLSLSGDAEVLSRATNPAAVRLLWDVCQIPDFRKVMPDIHARLLRYIFLSLCDGGGRLESDWVAAQIGGLDNVSGDIDTLTQRIAHVRTWTYISHRANWLSDAEAWQGEARRIEDKLSDALHDRLTQRFVDRHAPLLAKRRREGGELSSFIDKTGDVVVEGASIGQMTGLGFVPDATAGDDGRVLLGAARRAIEQDVERRVNEIVATTDDAFSVGGNSSGGNSGLGSPTLCWNDASIAELAAGETALNPQIFVLDNEFLDGPRRERVRARLAVWMSVRIERRLGPLFQALSADVDGPLRGLIFQLAESLGSASRADIKVCVDKLSGGDKKKLAKLGIRIGLHSVYFHELLNSTAVRMRSILASACTLNKEKGGQGLPRGNKPSRPAGSTPRPVWAMLGYSVVGGRAIRVDVLEGFTAIVRKLARSGPFAATPNMLSLAGGDAAILNLIMRDLGYVMKETSGGPSYQRKPRRSRQQKGGKERVQKNGANKGGASKAQMDPNSPFAKLRELAFVK